MALPAGFPYPLNQVVEIPLEQIIPNPNQPRRSMRQEPLGTLAASMKAKGQLTHAKVRPLTEAERAIHPGGWVMLVGGHRRRQATLLNGFKTLKCIADDIAPEDTHYQALMDNDHEEMDWWDWDLAIEEESKTFQGTLEELAIRLNKGLTKVYGALKIGKAFNSTARTLVDENLQKTLKNDLRPAKSKNKGFLITENTLLVLADLEDPGQVQQALQVVLDDYLTTDQAQKLVEHIQAGNPIDTFNPAMKMAKPKTSHSVTHSPERGISVPSGPQPAAHHASPTSNAVRDPLSEISSPSEPQQSQNNWFWNWIFNIKFMKEMRSKYKKGEPLTRWEKFCVLCYGTYQKTKPARKALNHWLKNLLGKKHYNLLKTVMWVILIWALLWGAGKFWQMVVTNPLHWIESKAKPGFHADSHTESAQSNPVSQPVASTQMLASSLPPIQSVIHQAPEKKIEKTAPTIAYQPSIAFSTSASPADSSPVSTLYDPKLLEQEIAAVPKNAIVKAFPVTPDETMPGDLAVSRMQGVTDPDKYTMMIGSGKQKMNSVTATATNLTINYKSADAIGGFLDGNKDPFNIFWEDVKYIHSDEIDIQGKNPSTFYQCSLVESGSKSALTFQCVSTDDLKHLVSTMEYFIRHSRLARDTALAGMPYPLQGLVLNNDCVVDKIWSDSPADKAGIQSGDMIWSVDKDALDQPDRKPLETQLTSLTSGSHDLYLVSPADRDKAQGDVNFNQARVFNPKRRKVILRAI